MRASGSSELGSSKLESALSEYAQAAAHVLHADVVAGAEVELELGLSARSRADPVLQLPAADGPVHRRARGRAQRLPEHGAAVAALSGFDGLERYLAGRTVREARAGWPREDVSAKAVNAWTDRGHTARMAGSASTHARVQR